MTTDAVANEEGRRLFRFRLEEDLWVGGGKSDDADD
jgi:hypothetical protein